MSDFLEDDFGKYTEITLKIGDNVLWYDRYGRPRPALVQAIHGDETMKKYQSFKNLSFPDWPEKTGIIGAPSINILVISDNPDKSDSYGRQIEHETSVPHKEDQRAHGYYWDFTIAC
jgi:hypothetical protein